MSGGFAPSAGSRLRLAFVRGLTLQALLGVHPREKATLQRVGLPRDWGSGCGGHLRE